MCTYVRRGKKQVCIYMLTDRYCNCLVPAEDLINNKNKTTNHKKY